MRSVPFFNYPFLYKADSDNYLKVISEVCEKGAFIMQADLKNFEQRIADYCGVKYAVGVANATDGLQIGMQAAGLQAGDEVLFCSHTMVATASAIHFAGGVPVPVETGEDHLMCVDDIEARITSKTRAICPTQLNGRIADMDRIQEVADKHGLMIFEDAAQALGAKYKGRGIGTFGKAACVSFYPAKILGSFGDGGLVLTNDEDVYEKMLLLRDHGRSAKTGDVELWGFNTRLDNLQAAILNHNFDSYDKIVLRRRELASLYTRLLKNNDRVKLPPAPDADENHFDVFQNYEIEADRRDELKQFLGDNKIGTLVQWGGKAVHQFEKLGFTQSLPKTEALFEKMIMLPLNMSLADEDVEYVCEKVNQFYA